MLQEALHPVLRLLLPGDVEGASAEISLLLCDDGFMQDLNRRYRGIDRPTDVLSFAQEGQPGPGTRVLGDIVISLETADRQAQAADWPLVSEVGLLAAHGLLHLLGHEDETLEGASEMQVRTVEALRIAGVAFPDAEKHPFLKETCLSDASSAAS